MALNYKDAPDKGGYSYPEGVRTTADERRHVLKRVEQLRAERQSWMPTWKTLADYILPREYRELYEDRNQGARKDTFIINNTATISVRTLSSGMMTSMTNAARVWFRLKVSNTTLAEMESVKLWLDEVVRRLEARLSTSNIYTVLHQFYYSIVTFGTAGMLVQEDDHDGIRAYLFPLGSFMAGNNARREVDTIAREFSMTVKQLVEQFTLEKCSNRVKDEWKKGHHENWHTVAHLIEPNRNYSSGKLGPKGKRFRSCWLEKKGDDDAGFLLESGFNEFPCMVARWMVTGEDVYGTGPGHDAIGDIKGLQKAERNAAKAQDKINDPPMVGPSSLQNQRASLIPGDVTYLDQVGPGSKFEPAVVVPPAAVTVMLESIQRHERRIERSFLADVWLMLQEKDGTRTAREVQELAQEKLEQLGPVFDRLYKELLKPLVERVFAIELRAGRLPPMPQELSGQAFEVECTSAMALAQKALGNASIERTYSFVMQLAQAKPEVLDVIDGDAAVREYGEATGLPAKLLIAPEEVQKVRLARAKQMQQQQQQASMMAAAQTAKTASQADLSGDNGLSRLVGSFSPVAGAAAASGSIQ